MADLLSTFAIGSPIYHSSLLMTTLRLTRVGKRKQPSYRLVVQDKRRDPWSPALDIVGSYNPRTKALTVKEDRIKEWIAKGCQMTAAVNNLLITNGILKGDKMKATVGDHAAFAAKLEEAKKKKDEPKEEAAPEAPAATETPAA